MQIQISWLRSQLIWIYTVYKGCVYPGSAGQALNNNPMKIKTLFFIFCCYRCISKYAIRNGNPYHRSARHMCRQVGFVKKVLNSGRTKLAIRNRKWLSVICDQRWLKSAFATVIRDCTCLFHYVKTLLVLLANSVNPGWFLFDGMVWAQVLL